MRAPVRLATRRPSSVPRPRSSTGCWPAASTGTVKHFPGLGRILNNTDFNAPRHHRRRHRPPTTPTSSPSQPASRPAPGWSWSARRCTEARPRRADAVLDADRHRPAARRPRLDGRRHHRRRQRPRRWRPPRSASGRRGCRGRRRHRAHRRRVDGPVDAQGPQGRRRPTTRPSPRRSRRRCSACSTLKERMGLLPCSTTKP